MINRVLIRIKVVQLLYSYLLVENQFHLESQPASPTKEKRFAYGLYLDLLYLMTQMGAGISVRGDSVALSDTRFIRRVSADEHIRSLARKYSDGSFPFAPVVDSLTAALRESGLYKTFRKSEHQGSIADEVIWPEVFKQIIMTDPQVNEIIRTMENHTLMGVERMRDMMDHTFRAFFAAGDHLPDALKELGRSMLASRDLYFRLLYLPVELCRLREHDIEEARNKYITTAEERNPNMRFVENELVARLRDNERISSFIHKRGASWLPDDEGMLRSLLRAIMASDIYKEYMEYPATDFAMDCELWRNLFKHVIFCNPDLLETLEDKSVFWNDDIDIIGTFILKTLRRLAEKREEDPVLEMYKDDEDAEFGAQLFSYVVKGKDDYRVLIDETVDKSQWEMERLAYMDVVCMMAALAEMLNFPKIPLHVTINEYVEIAKAYSTAKSAQFVHGLLAKIIDRLQEEKRLLKQ